MRPCDAVGLQPLMQVTSDLPDIVVEVINGPIELVIPAFVCRRLGKIVRSKLLT
jgi:hypothetical protein